MRLDLGFLGADKEYNCAEKILLPNKKPRKSKNNPEPRLTDEQKQENKELSKVRVFVEHAIGGMKHFHCLVHRIRSQSTSTINQFLSLSAGLWNLKIS